VKFGFAEWALTYVSEFPVDSPMITADDPFVRLVLGKIVHVTSVQGFAGIQRDGFIRPNRGDLKRTFGSASSGSYYCQKIGAVSVLDLKHADPQILFGDGYIQNWHAVFTYHSPAMVLILALGEEEHRLIRCELGNGKSIPAVEGCFPGAIGVEYIENILITYGSTERFVDTGVTALTNEMLTHLRFAAEMLEAAKPRELLE
jgi:hypothetical protein